MKGGGEVGGELDTRGAPGGRPPGLALPVLIAGAGPVGLTTALLLANWGVPTTVLEAAPGQVDIGSRAICFQRDVLDILDRIGCAAAIVDEGVTWTTGRTFYREHELFSVTFEDHGNDSFPPWINISQDSVERYLLAKATARPWIKLRFGHRVSAIKDHGDHVEVHAQTDAGPSTFTCDYLIGADGAQSMVRRLLDISFDGKSYPDQFLICDIRADLPFPRERRFYFDPAWNPGRQVLVHQCPDGVWRIDWQVPADFDLTAENTSGGLDRRISQVTGGEPYELVWASAYRFAERVAGTFSQGRVYLAGDAAHVYAPFGARGLNSGIQDAENLAWKLAYTINGWSPPTRQQPQGAHACAITTARGPCGDRPALLDTYHVERSAAARENLLVTSATMDFLVPQTDERRRWRTEVLDRAVTDPGARKLIDSGKLAEPFWYPASPLTTQGQDPAGIPQEPGAHRPPRPGVLCPDGPALAYGKPTRLRKFFGQKIVILTAAAETKSAASEVAANAIAAPVDVYALTELDVSGELRRSLDAKSTSVHIIRPDGHLAAVLPRFDPAELAAALKRMTGRPAAPAAPS